MRGRPLLCAVMAMAALPPASFDCSSPDSVVEAAPPRSLQSSSCASEFPDAHAKVTAELAAGEEHGVVLFGWENCPCTWYATNRFDAEELCYRRLTWADRNSDLMLYLQCVEGNNNDHSFIYTKDGGKYKFQGNGFAFMTSAMTPSTLNTMLNKASASRECPKGSFACTEDCFFDDISASLAESALSPSYRYGVSIVDTDGDHRFEAVVCGYTGPNLVLSWEGDGFVDHARELGMESAGLRSIGIASCDVDGDGVEEVYVLNTGAYAGTANSQSDNLFKKTASGWEDLFAQSQNAAARNLFAGRSVACVDRFGQGRYGVAAASYGEQIHLYEVADSGKISDVGPSVGFTGTPGGRGITAGPLAGRSSYTPDRPGTDVFFVNEMNPSYGANGCNFLFQAQPDGSFVDVAPDFDVQDCYRGGRGVAVVDVDIDGRLDLVNGNWGTQHRLWVRDGSNRYKDVATPEMSEPSYIRTVIAADLDNDGHTELFWNNIDSYGRGAPNRLFTQTEDGSWERVLLGPAELPLGHGTGAAVADFDQDGVLELLISHGESASQPMALFRARGATANRFLRVLLKFTSLAVMALIANVSAVKINGPDPCNNWGGKNGLCKHGLSYDLDEDTLKAAKADNVAKTQHFNGATKADADAKAALGAATGDAAAKAAANAGAGAAKSATQQAWADTSYADPSKGAKEAAKNAAIAAKEGALDASLKADDMQLEKNLIADRKARDLAASTAAKAASDANLAANEARFATEKDQLWRGEDQDRNKHALENTDAATSAIQAKHDERERANGRLLKALA